MTIRNLFAATSIISIIAFTGCAASKTASSGLEPAPVTTSPAIPGSTISEKTDESPSSDVVKPESGTDAVNNTDLAGNTNKETRLDTVYFDFDSYILSANARDTLTRNAKWLHENRYLQVIIEGHADEIGSDSYNLALGEKRALAVRRYIETLGISREHIETISYGEEKPAVVGHDETAWAKNRRVEFIIVK